MPRGPKTTVAQRREWLERYDRGEWYDKLAVTEGVNPRTVRDGVERARRERDFELAQRDQLREALAAHQRDLLTGIRQIETVVQVLPIDFALRDQPDFGFEPQANGQRLDVDLYEGFPSAPQAPALTEEPVLVVRRSGSGISGLELLLEEAALWRALREHVGKADPLWRKVTEWKSAFLAEIRARGALNLAIRRLALPLVEEPKNAKKGEPADPAPAFYRFVREQATRAFLGQPGASVQELLRVDEGRVALADARETSLLLRHPKKPATALTEIAELVATIEKQPETEQTGKAFQALGRAVRQVHRETETYRLMHHVVGRCALCRKMGAS